MKIGLKYKKNKVSNDIGTFFFLEGNFDSNDRFIRKESHHLSILEQIELVVEALQIVDELLTYGEINETFNRKLDPRVKDLVDSINHEIG